MWHQPCQRCKYTSSVDIQKRTIKIKKAASHSRRITYKHSESAQDRRTALYKSDQQPMALLIFKNGINFMYKTGRIVTEIKAIPKQEEGMLFNSHSTCKNATSVFFF